MALVKVATTDPDKADKLMRNKWQPYLTTEERHWVWGVIGRQSAMRWMTMPSPTLPVSPTTKT